MDKCLYPFTAIVGQEKVKKGIILNLISPEIGGLLLSGEKGAAKSTIIRSIESLMNGLSVFTVPLNATEDCVIGSVNMEEALMSGQIIFEPGILSRAHENILYIDEVNLLSDSIANIILDSAALKVNHVEREGISYSHESDFILFGSMNPEEGYLKPQLLDRFGFFVEVAGSEILAERIEIISRRLEYEKNSVDFNAGFADKEEELVNKIIKAKKLISTVEIPIEITNLIAKICGDANAAGHRGDIALTLGARANAAFDGRLKVSLKDVKEVMDLALSHRFRDAPTVLEEENNEASDEMTPEDEETTDQEENTDSPEDENVDPQAEESADESSSNEEVENNSSETDNNPLETPQGDYLDNENFEIDESFVAKDILNELVNKRLAVQGSGRRNKTRSHSKIGRYIKYKLPKGKVSDIAFDATVRQAAPYQNIREKSNLLITIHKEDIREKVREKRVGNMIMFVVDASGSMGINKRMSVVKGAIFSLLQDAYQKRDTVGLMTFRGNQTEVALNPTRSIDLAYRKLQEIETGGKTPLSLGIRRSVEFIKSKRAKDQNIVPIVIIISDGRGNVSIENKPLIEEIEEMSVLASKEHIEFIVVDTETGFLKLGLAKKMADKLDALYLSLEELRDGELVEAIKQIG